MLSRRTITALAGLLAVLVAVIALVATASADSTLGRTRGHLGDAAESVGDALTVPSPSPVATTTPPTATDVDARVAAQATRTLLDSAQGHLALGTRAGNIAAAKEYDAAVRALDGAGAGADQASVDRLFADAATIRARLLVLFPAPSASPSATPTPSPTPSPTLTPSPTASPR